MFLSSLITKEMPQQGGNLLFFITNQAEELSLYVSKDEEEETCLLLCGCMIRTDLMTPDDFLAYVVLTVQYLTLR